MKDYVNRRVNHQSGLPHLPWVPHLQVNRPLNTTQCFLKRCNKQRYTSELINIYDLLEKCDRRLFTTIKKMLTIHYMPFCRNSESHPRGYEHKQVNYHGLIQNVLRIATFANFCYVF